MNIEVVRRLIKKHTQGHAQVILKTAIAERYYRNDNDILHAPKDSDRCEVENPLRSADNRVPRNFYGLLVNQKAAYMFTAPPLFDVGGKAGNEAITDVLGDAYAKVCKDLCVNASNAGIGWLHYWVNKEKIFEYGAVDSKQIIPVWSAHLNKKLLAVLRVYQDTDDLGDTWDIYEYWTDVECWAYRKLAAAGIDAGLVPCAIFTNTNMAEANQYRHDLGRVPFIPFPNNNILTSDLDNIKPLIDVFDKVYSGFANDLEDIQEIIFLLTNYGGNDLASFLADIKKYKTVKVDSVGADDKSGLETLTIDIPVEAREKLLDMTRKAIFEQGQGVDPQPQNFGNASGVALKYLYSLLELKAGLMETEFKLAFGELVRAICRFKEIKVKKIIQTWTRTAITNDAELAEMCSKSKGVISDKSIIKNHPFVEDADAEGKQIKAELEAQRQEMDEYRQAFAQAGGGNET